MKDLSTLFTQLIGHVKNESDPALEESILGAFCSRLESMGYDVSINGQRINSKDLVPSIHREYQDLSGSALFFSLSRKGEPEQDYMVDFAY
jgi:hypothetical protein